MRWVTFFDLQPTSFSVWGPLAAVMGIAALWCWMAYRGWAAVQSAEVEGRRISFIASASIVSLGAVAVIAILSEFVPAYFTFRNILRSGQYRTVEGPVHNLESTRKLDRFNVNGVEFWYGIDLTPCFHKLVADGGPMREGLYVRIRYVDDPVLKRNSIIRLEIRK
jgi:hypothetical protein